MAERVWTAAEVEAMSPSEQDDLFDASIVTDLDEVPPVFLARVRARFAERTGGVDSPHPR